MNLPLDTVTIVALSAAGGVLLLLVAVVLLGLRLRRMRRAYGAALDPARAEDLFEAVQRQARQLDEVRTDVTTVHANTEHLRAVLRGTLSRVGLVRYDAFADMGGALSFSAALLDEDGHGVVVSAINGRSETRCYAKPIRDGDSDQHLSDEEAAAIRAAMQGQKGQVAEVVTGRRGRRRAS